MFKNIIALVVVSLLVCFEATASAGQWLLNKLFDIHSGIAGYLAGVFSETYSWVVFLSKALALFIFPAVLTGMIAFLFWAVRRYRMPHVLPVFWILWVVQAVVVLLH